MSRTFLRVERLEDRLAPCTMSGEDLFSVDPKQLLSFAESSLTLSMVEHSGIDAGSEHYWVDRLVDVYRQLQANLLEELELVLKGEAEKLAAIKDGLADTLAKFEQILEDEAEKYLGADDRIEFQLQTALSEYVAALQAASSAAQESHDQDMEIIESFCA